MSLLSLKHVYKTFYTNTDETQTLCDLSFDVKQGEFVAIVGPSGCGKTTILSLICGTLKPSSGDVTVFGSAPPSSEVGYMLQHDHLFEWRTIYKNVTLGLEIQKQLTEENVAFVTELLNKYGLGEFVESYPHQLSGGMRQRVALIRTLAQNPKLLLLDEPFSSLDYQTRLSVCDDVFSIIRREQKTALLVTHDISEAISLADRIIVLTKRPSTVKNIHVISFDKELPPLKRRETTDFSKYFEKIWRELNNDKTTIART